MDGGLLQILIFAAIAAFLFFRLFSVLGRRTGHEQERPPLASRRAPEADGDAEDKVVELPRRDSDSESAAEAEPVWGSDGPVAAGLTQIRLADREFDLDTFLAGSRAAFAMILEAYHKGELEKVRGLLAEDVYRSFAAAVAAREAEVDQRSESELVSVNGCKAVEAEMAGKQARITVRFESEQTEVVKDREGRIVSGDLTHPLDVIDEWTFARDTRSRDPNWQLVATRSPE